MTRRILKKLNSRRGASMIAALLFFLICSFVGGIVLSNASVNVGRTHGERRSRQAFLAVSSAAALVQKDLEGLRFTGAYKVVEETVTTVTGAGNNSSTSVAVTTSGPQPDPDKTRFDFGGGKLLENAGLDLSDIYYFNLDGANPLHIILQDTDTQSCELSFSPQDADLSILTVEGELIIGTDYSLTVTLSDENGDRTLTMSYSPTVSMPVVTSSVSVSSSGNTATETVTTVYTTEVTWGDPVLSEGRSSP